MKLTEQQIIIKEFEEIGYKITNKEINTFIDKVYKDLYIVIITDANKLSFEILNKYNNKTLFKSIQIPYYKINFENIDIFTDLIDRFLKDFYLLVDFNYVINM